MGWLVPLAHYMMTSSNGNIFPVPGEFHTQRPMTPSFDVFFNLRLNKRLSKQSWGWWFETLSRPLWRHCNERPCPLYASFENKSFMTEEALRFVLSGKRLMLSRVTCLCDFVGDDIVTQMMYTIYIPYFRNVHYKVSQEDWLQMVDSFSEYFNPLQSSARKQVRPFVTLVPNERRELTQLSFDLSHYVREFGAEVCSFMSRFADQIASHWSRFYIWFRISKFLWISL